MDTVITSDIDTSSGTAGTATADQPTATETAASETKETEGGGEQSSAEGGQPQTGGRRKWSIQDEVKELRAQRRELREQLSSFGSVREELAALREELNRRAPPGTAKTPANFWQDPEAIIESKLERLRDELAGTFQQSREQEYQLQALRQEQASAVEFIRTQKGYDPTDDEDLIEIIESVPNRQHLSPQMVAEYAWLRLQAQRGVGDRGLAKRQASGVQGQPPGVGFGRKVWAKADFDAAVDMLEKNPHDPKNAELLKELESAHKEGRVR